jgi:hypothetical protein
MLRRPTPTTWGARDQAEQWLDRLEKPCDLFGTGLVLTAVDAERHLAGIDLDTCRFGGNLADWAIEIIERFGTYAEVSPSGAGVKIFFLMRASGREEGLAEVRAAGGDPKREGTKWALGTGERHPPAIELFLGKRYFAVTHQRIEGSPEELRIVGTEDVRWLVREAGPAFLRQLAGRNGDGRPRDDSRSAVAVRKGLELVRVGAGYDQMCEALRANPETALAGMQATAPAGWAALSTSGLVALRLPPIVCTIVILADNDRHGAGERAARTAAQRWLAEGRRVRIALPPEPGTDMADVLAGRAYAGIVEVRDAA